MTITSVLTYKNELKILVLISMELVIIVHDFYVLREHLLLKIAQF